MNDNNVHDLTSKKVDKRMEEGADTFSVTPRELVGYLSDQMDNGDIKVDRIVIVVWTGTDEAHTLSQYTSNANRMHEHYMLACAVKAAIG